MIALHYYGSQHAECLSCSQQFGAAAHADSNHKLVLVVGSPDQLEGEEAQQVMALLCLPES